MLPSKMDKGVKMPFEAFIHSALQLLWNIKVLCILKYCLLIVGIKNMYYTSKFHCLLKLGLSIDGLTKPRVQNIMFKPKIKV